jgi:hypothetical protein
MYMRTCIMPTASGFLCGNHLLLARRSAVAACPNIGLVSVGMSPR